MRLDKYLKVSRLIKRRSVANEACAAGRVALNGKTAKPSAEVKEGDLLTIELGARSLQCRVRSVRETAAKAEASDMYEVLGHGTGES